MKSTAQYTNYRHEEREASGTIGTRYNQQVVGLDVLARHGEAESAHSGAVGARYQFRDIGTGGTLRTPSTYDNSAALFLVEEWVVQRLRLQGGVRYDWSRYVPYEKNSGILVNDRIIPTDPRTFGSFSGSVGSLYTGTPTCSART